MELIDSHVHLLYPERFSYAWCQSSPVLNRAFRLEDYRAAARSQPGVRVRSAIVMEADVPAAQQDAEAEFYGGLTGSDRQGLPLAAVIAAAWPEAEDFPARLEKSARDSRIRGLRRVLHTMPEELAQAAGFADNLRRLESYGLPFDLCIRPHLLPTVTVLSDRCPGVQFVLDHCGVPDVARDELDPWRADLRELAARENVACKFSGLASMCEPSRPMTPQVRRFFDHCLDCFGPERLMWGSDWPLCNLTFDLAAWLATTADLLGELSESEQGAIATGTATRIYRLG